MLEEHDIEFHYRDYKKIPLTRAELDALLVALDATPASVLRKHDPVAKANGFDLETPAETLVEAMATHPTLLQRPIGLLDGRAVVGRPPERLLALIA